MSTRSLVGKVAPSGRIKYIYVHSDGYPTYNGVVLHRHWTGLKKVNQLLELGDLSSLGKVIGEKHDFNSHFDNDEMPDWCLSYNRDRGEQNVAARVADDFASFVTVVGNSWAEYIYLFVEGKWVYSDTYNKKFKDISELKLVSLESISEYVDEHIADSYQDSEIASACEEAGWDVPEEVAARLKAKKEAEAKTT